MVYSDEYLEDLEMEREELTRLYNEVMRRAGNGPYNREEKQIIHDYKEVMKEYDSIKGNRSLGSRSFFKEKEPPASKKKPIYCDKVEFFNRVGITDFVLVRGKM